MPRDGPEMMDHLVMTVGIKTSGVWVTELFELVVTLGRKS